MRTIILHGALAQEFGREFTLDVKSPAEAIRALVLHFKGFRQRMSAGMYRVVRGPVEGRGLELEELRLKLGRAKELHIVPVIAGRANGLGKILAGVAIVALAIAAPYALGIAGGLGAAIPGISIFGATVSFGQVAALGLGMALTGVAQMLSPSPQMQGGRADVDRRESFLFSGQENVTKQGGPVGLPFGLYMIGSTVIAVGVDVEQVAVDPPPPRFNPTDALQ